MELFPLIVENWSKKAKHCFEKYSLTVAHYVLLLRFDNIALEIHVSKMNSEISEIFSQPTSTTFDDFYL